MSISLNDVSEPNKNYYYSLHNNIYWRCALTKNHQLFSDEDICSSVDHGCEHVCVNADESYVCQCYEGFALRQDGKTCRSKFTYL